MHTKEFGVVFTTYVVCYEYCCFVAYWKKILFKLLVHVLITHTTIVERFFVIIYRFLMCCRFTTHKDFGVVFATYEEFCRFLAHMKKVLFKLLIHLLITRKTIMVSFSVISYRFLMSVVVLSSQEEFIVHKPF